MTVLNTKMVGKQPHLPSVLKYAKDNLKVGNALRNRWHILINLLPVSLNHPPQLLHIVSAQIRELIKRNLLVNVLFQLFSACLLKVEYRSGFSFHKHTKKEGVSIDTPQSGTAKRPQENMQAHAQKGASLVFSWF